MPQSLPLPLQLPLPAPGPPPPLAPKGRPRPKAAAAVLWAAVHLPALPLEALDERADAVRAVAVIDGETPRAAVVAATAAARAAGVGVGMTAGAAAAHVELELRVRDPVREMEALQRLAAWGERFTSFVSLEPPDALLLEVGGSLKLFGGIKPLQARLLGVEASGYTASVAFAPTPRAALWLARTRGNVEVSVRDQLQSVLGTLPLAALCLPEDSLHQFRRLGANNLRELFRLPRAGLARRFDPMLLREWDRALGRLAEPRRHWRAAARFHGERKLPAALYETSRLEPFLHSLLDELIETLRRHDAGIDRLTVFFRHEQVTPATKINLKLLTVTREAAHLRRLLHVRLECVRLPVAATAIELASGVFKPVAAPVGALIEIPATPAAEASALIETLRARLGREAVSGIAPVADHRPEHAWRRIEPDAKTPAGEVPLQQRPGWLLSTPQVLQARDGVPWFDGRPLSLISGPERIAGGWWAGDDIGRDYYIARAYDGARLWIYRGHGGTRRWCLHGYFA